ncbi:MAG: hypothetical protein ACR2K2_05685 [Mycobacteriales bacterium]
MAYWRPPSACSGWLDGGRLLLYAAGATFAGLAHWFALPVVAGLALSGLLLRRRQAVGLLGLTALAATPTLLLVGLTQVNGIGDSAIAIRSVGIALPGLALEAGSAGSLPLLVATVLAVAAGIVRGVRGDQTARRVVVVGACWVGLPLVLLTVAELLRPVFVPRYLLATLLGLSVLAVLADLIVPPADPPTRRPVPGPSGSSGRLSASGRCPRTTTTSCARRACG